MNKYLIIRKKGEFVNRLFYLSRDSYSKTIVPSSPHISWLTRIIKKIKTKDDVIKYHRKKLEKIKNSKHLMLSKEMIEDYNKLIVSIDNVVIEHKDDYKNISEAANDLRSKISVPMLFSIFAGKINAFEVIIFLIIFILIYFFLV